MAQSRGTVGISEVGLLGCIFLVGIIEALAKSEMYILLHRGNESGQEVRGMVIFPHAMAGDGINDAPALVAAEVGVAMGAAGSDAAIEVAGVALMGDDLSKLLDAMALAQKARRIIIQNICLAFAMKLIFVAGLFLGVWVGYSLIGGVIADVGTTLLVTANGLRLLRGVQMG